MEAEEEVDPGPSMIQQASLAKKRSQDGYADNEWVERGQQGVQGGKGARVWRPEPEPTKPNSDAVQRSAGGRVLLLRVPLIELVLCAFWL